MDYIAYKFWFDVAQTLFIALIGIQQFLYRKQSATISSIERIDNHATKGISSLDKRVIRLEEFVLHVPSNQDLHKMNEKNTLELEKIYKEINSSNGLLQQLIGSNKHIINDLENLKRHALDRETGK
jgi:hypothetical protein